MENTLTPENESTNEAMVLEDARQAFVNVSLKVDRVKALVSASIELSSDERCISYRLMQEAMNVINELAEEVDARELDLLGKVLHP